LKIGPLDYSSQSQSVQTRPIWHHLDDFQNSTGVVLPMDTSVVKFLWRFDQFVWGCESSCRKMPYLTVLKNPAKNPGSGCGCGWPPKFYQFFLVDRHIHGKIFTKVCYTSCTPSSGTEWSNVL